MPRRTLAIWSILILVVFVWQVSWMYSIPSPQMPLPYDSAGAMEYASKWSSLYCFNAERSNRVIPGERFLTNVLFLVAPPKTGSSRLHANLYRTAVLAT